MANKIKISAPRVNPHVCYIGREYKEKIEALKSATGMSLYAILCKCSGKKLDTVEHIKKYKEQVRKNGFRTIGEWAEALITILYENIESINSIDWSSITIRIAGREKK